MAKGVEVRGQSIRVYFSYQGAQVKEPVPGAPSPARIAYYERMVQNINDDIKNGTFDYARYFPDSERLEQNSLGAYLDIWLKIKGNEVAESTFRAYKQKAELWIRPYWGKHQLEKIDHIMLQDWVQSVLSPALHNKTIREVITILRQVFRLYRTRNQVAHDPTEGLGVRLPDPDDPDPFTRDEIRRILETPTKRRMEQLLIQFMVWAGPRLSEAIALAWEDVDLKRGEVTFARSNVRGIYKSTKTRRSTRKLQLLKPALEALREMEALSGGMRPSKVKVVDRDNKTQRDRSLRFVFLNTQTLEPHANDFSVRDRFFKAHLNKAGVRYRGPNQCRHTFASQILSSGAVSVDWVANYMGHTSSAMVWRHYGKWIPNDGLDVIKVLNAALEL